MIFIGNISSKLIQLLKIYKRLSVSWVRIFNSLSPRANFSDPEKPI